MGRGHTYTIGFRSSHFSFLGPEEKIEVHANDTVEIPVEGTHVDITVKIYVVDAREDKLYEIHRGDGHERPV